MLLKLIRSIKCFAIVIGLFLFASVAVADVSTPFLINGKPFDDTVYWKVTLKAGSAGGLFGDTMGPVRTFRYETVVEVDGKETLVIPGGIYSTDMGSDAATYTVNIPLKDLGILKIDSDSHTYYLKAFTRSYEGNSDVDIGYSLLYVDGTVTVEYAGIVLTASDGKYEEYVKVEWKDKLSGETYHLCRDTQMIATGLTGSVYLDETAEPGKKYQYQVITSSGRESNQDEGYRRIIKPKLKRLVLKGVDVLEGYTPTTDKENFLVAGSVITVEAEVLDYDERYHTLVSAKLIGTPMGVPATKNHESGTVSGALLCTENFENCIVFTNTLNYGKGFHGQYEWKVEADFEVKGVDRLVNLASNPTNAPVFFKKDGKDQTGIPNWFTYWKKDGACPRLKDSFYQDIDVKICVTNLGDYGLCSGEWSSTGVLFANIYIDKEYGSLYHYEDGARKVAGKEFSGPHIWGIYTTEEILAHEVQHAKHKIPYWTTRKIVKENAKKLHYFQNMGSNEFENELDELWKSAYDTDYHEPQKYLEVDEVTSNIGRLQQNKPEYCDELFNSDETGREYAEYGLSVNKTDTHDVFGSIPRMPAMYKCMGDNEFLALMAANKATEAVSAKKENDWAFPGEQTCVPIKTMKARWDLAQSNKVNGINRDYGWYVRYVSDNKSMRSAAQDQTLRTRQVQAEFATTKSSSVAPAITVNGMTKEIGREEDDSFVTAVIYKFDMTVVGFNDLRLSGVLTDLNSNIVASAHTSVTSGNVVGELRFEGSDIYESGKDGAFKLESVKIISLDGDDYSELATLSEFKDGVVELNRKDLARNDAYLLNVVSETVSTNGIEVAINTEVNVAGGYEIFATLAGTNGMPVAMCRKAMDCSVGTNCFKVVFAASDILKSGVDGPYNIDNLALFKDGVRIDSRLDYSILRKNYRADAFDFEDGEEIDSDQFMSQFGDYTPPPELPPVKTYWVVFNANGGTTSETIREVKSGDEIGALPVAESGNDEFLGWYTELEGGTRISNTTIITTNVLYHAQWKEVIDEVVFTSTAVNTKEGDSVVVTIAGGTEESASSVQLYGVYNTAAAADLDLAKTLVDGKPIKGFKFPYTLTWEKGEYANHTVTFFTKVDKAVEDQEFLTLQLANPTGTLLGKNDVCTVRINDINSYATLQDGITNPNIKVSTKGDGKWIVSEGSAFDDDGSDGLYHVQSPKLKQGESSTLSFSTVKGNGKFYFYVRIITDSEEKVPSVLNVYDGKKLLGTIDYAQGANIWVRRHITVSGGSSTLPNNFNFVFVQGSNPDARIEISDVYWVNDGTPPIYFVTAWEDYTNGGYVTGSGTYLKGQTAKIVAKPLPGWEFAGWDEVIYDEVTGEISSIEFFSEKSTVSFRPTKNSYFIANFSKIPYVRGLADSADGGKVTGSGLCAEGKKVTLKASANKNFTFKGWYASILGNSNFVNETNCVATTASLVIDRTSKPMANSKTSTTITDITAGVTYFAVFEGDPRVAVSVNPAPEAGKVTGVGRYAPGKKVTVKATANKGYVFNGWYLGERCITQAANYAFTMPEEDVALIAKFVTAEEDAASIALSVDALGGEISPEAIISVTNTCGVALKWSVVADAFSQPKVTVSGLPAGLKFTAKDIMKEGSKTDVEIPANTIYGAPTAESKLDAKTGLRKPSAVKFTVTTAGKSKRVYPVDMTVLPLPDWAVGTFNGGGDLGQISLTVAKTGKLSGKYLSDGLTWSLAANSFDSIDDSGDVYRATLIGKSGKLVMTNDVGVACDAMGGFAESVDYIAYQNNWKLEPWKTIGKPFAKADALEYEDSASLAGVEAPGVLSLKFAASGAVTVKGAFVIGVNEMTGKEILYSASGSAVLAPQSEPDETGVFDAVVFVYLPPKAGKFDGYVRCIGVRWTGVDWMIKSE